MNSDSLTAGSSLPGANDPAPTVPSSQTTAHRNKRDAKTVLIADDDRDLVNILSVRCRRIGLKVLAAHDAFTALALIRSRLPDVICLDVEMPAGNGLSVCEMLAGDEACREIPVVILTGRTDPETIIRCHSLCAYYVEKCTDIWNRLEPLLKELFFTAEPIVPQIAPSAPAAIPAPIPSAEADVKAAQIPPVVEAAPVPHQETVGTVPSEPQQPAVQTAAPASQAAASQAPAQQAPHPELPAAVATDKTPAPQESPAAAPAEITEEADPADLAIGEEKSETTESVWKQLTQVVGRVVARTVSQPEESPVSESAAPPKRVAEDKNSPLTAVPAPVLFTRGTNVALKKPVDDENDRPQKAAPVGSTSDLDRAWTLIGKKSSGPPARTEKIADRKAPKEQDGQAQKTILIADDDGDLVQMIALRCSQIGIRVFRSPDAMHALLGVHRIRPDLVLLDVNMPGGNGLSICEMLAGDESLAKIPVIIMTGDSAEEIPRRCQALHAQFLAKGPGLWERLETMLQRALGLPESPAAKEAAEAKEPAADKRRPRILCIDDDPDISKILKFRLESFGVDVLRAFNGMQGYWTALDMRPDMIILDMVMPDGGGNYIFGRLRSHPLTEKVPVLMLTGVNTPGVRRQMFGLGVDAYLTKPLDFNALLDHVRQYVPLVPRDESAAPQAAESERAEEEHAHDLVMAGSAGY